MKHKIILKAEGDNASGKSYLLNKIKSFLEEEGFKVNDSFLNDKHEIVVMNEY
jgi:uridine kinase